MDILLVTSLVYAALVWLRRTQAWFVAVGIVLLAALYAIAQAMDLRLTTWLLNSLFATLVVVIVVIFQDELRQLFERLAIISLRRRPPAPAEAGTADVITQTLGDLARARVGALVVLPGRQPIDRYVRGGLPLDGRLSVPLLWSLFDPHSPGHDGAVIVSGDRVTRFAAHLPLSTDFTQLVGVGTRHAAALGLAELTDVLCLVVSEERGQIAVARAGRLLHPVDAASLNATLGGFFAEMRPPERRRFAWRPLLFEHGAEKLASLLVVTGLWWALVPGSRIVEREFPVPVRVVNLPPTLVLERVEPEAVSVTLAAEQRAFYLFNPRLLEVTVDATLAGAGRRTFTISEDTLRLPNELELRDVEPQAVRLAVRPAQGGASVSPEVD